MTEVRVDAAAVRSLVRGVLGSADRIDEIVLTTMESDAMAGSAVAGAASSPVTQEQLAELAVHLRDWAAAATTATADIESAQMRHVGRLGVGG